MAKHKFQPGNNGRPKGAPNKVTMETREAFKRLVEANHDNLTTWLEQVATDDPKAALDIIVKLAEFVTPKLQRTEAVHAISTNKEINLKELVAFDDTPTPSLPEHS